MKIKVKEYMEEAKRICEENGLNYNLLKGMCRSYNDDSMIFLKDNYDTEISIENMLKNNTKMIKVMEIYNTKDGFKYKIYEK